MAGANKEVIDLGYGNSAPTLDDLLIVLLNPQNVPVLTKQQLRTVRDLFLGSASADGDFSVYNGTNWAINTVESVRKRLGATFTPVVFGFVTPHVAGDGKGYLSIPAYMDGWKLHVPHARVITAGTTGTLDIQIYNVTQAVDMLTTVLSVDSGETGSDTAATAAVVNAGNATVAAYDLLRIDIDAVQTTAGKGLILQVPFGD